jgi:cytochrome c oxidase subunit 1
MFILGDDGMVRRVSRYPQHPGWAWLNQLSTAGSVVVAIGVLIFLINLVVSMRRRVPAGNDPWQGHTLEWATSSPPPPLNFEGPLPPIRSYAPLLDLRQEAEDRESQRGQTTTGTPA